MKYKKVLKLGEKVKQKEMHQKLKKKKLKVRK